MPRKKTLETINIEREKVLLKGYANISDIKRFIPCSDKKAKEINDEVIDKVTSQGKRVFMGIRAKYLLDYVGLTEKQISYYAEIERKNSRHGNVDWIN